MAVSQTKTVLVTGASSGIGQAVVDRFAREGWQVAATMRTPGKAPAFEAPPDRLLILRLDVTEAETITSAVAKTIDHFGGIDVIVNNAGYWLLGPFEALSQAQITRQIDTNLLGVMNVCRAVLPHFRQRQAGTIINVASMAGRMSLPYMTLYHATKWGLQGFSESLAYELAPCGIKVKIIEPGPIKSDFYGRSVDKVDDTKLADAYVEFAPTAAKLRAFGADALGPEIVARDTWRAANDGSTRLRYAPNARAFLFGRWLLPDRLYMAIVRLVFGLKSGKRRAR